MAGKESRDRWKRTKLEKADHRKSIAELRLRRYTTHEIADKLGLSETTVRNEVNSIEKEWREQSVATIEERQQNLLRIIDRLVAEAWESWDMSRCDENGDVIAVGDPKFLTAITGLIEKELKMILPKELNGKDGPTVVFTDSQFEALLKRRADSTQS
jgi:orotate phosphoribosyltransferase-like protein